MKHKRLTVLFCLASLCLCAGVLTACRQSVLTKEKIYADGYNCEVTFDLAGGKSGKDDREREELHQYVKSGSPIIQPGTDKDGVSGAAPVKAGYSFGGYYRGTKDENGTITYEEKWDFKKDKVTGDLTLYAYWRENYSIVIHYSENYEKTTSVEVTRDENGAVELVKAPSISGHTVIAYFEDRATAESALEAPTAGEGPDEQRIKFPMKPTDKVSDENKVWDIYANALEGSFTVVRTQSQFLFSDGANIYLMIDLNYAVNNVKGAVSFPNDYSGTFYGNGHTISNFTVTRSASTNGNSYLGLFNRLTETAHLYDITFENFVLNVSTAGLSAGYYNYIGTLAGRAEAGATLRSVVLHGEVIYSFVAQTAGERTEDRTGIADKANGFADTGYQCDVEWKERSAS